jgi:3-phenylpropionate/cinnamic acid dioxygenase small subunit
MATQHYGTIAEEIIAPDKLLNCINFGQPIHNDIMHFFTLESRCLDDDRLVDWLDFLAEDVFYTVPIRQTTTRKFGHGFNKDGFWLYDSKAEIKYKMKRLAEGDSGWSEDPASRTRRFISSVLVYETTKKDEYFVQSNILVKRGRGDDREMETLSGRRDDILRKTATGWEIVRRHVLLDHTVLSMQNFAIFV